MPLIRHDRENEVQALANACIARYGCTAEHSYEYFVYYTAEDESRVFFQSPEGFGLMAYENRKERTWELLGDPIAPLEARAQLVAQFLEMTAARAKKWSLELFDETYCGVRAALPANLSMSPIIETLLWPCVDLRAYDPALTDPHYKSLRNVRSRFSREHIWSLRDARDIASDQLHTIVNAWASNRPATHPPYVDDYHALIDALPKSTLPAHALIVDDVPQAFFAGWQIPNTKGFYLFLSLHTYAHWGLGEMLMMQSIEWMKRARFAYVDLGGSDEPLLAFKKRFGATSAYETHRIEITPRRAFDSGR